MKTKHFLLIFLIFTYSNSLKSQSSYSSGFIVNNEGDTLIGLIKNFQNKKSFHTCYFKASEDSEVQKFLPTQIKYYGIGDEKLYRSDYLKKGEDSSLVFFETLVSGYCNLYKYKTDIGETIYKLWKQNRKEILLNNLQNKGNTNFMRGQLLYSFQDAPELKTNIQSMNFDQNSIIELTKDYHHRLCPDEECITYLKKNSKTSFSIGISGGNCFSNIIFKESERTNFKQDYTTSSDLIYGVHFNIYDPLISERIKLELGVLFHNIEYNSNEVSWVMSNTKAPIFTRINIAPNKLSPEILVGVFYSNLRNIKADSLSIEASFYVPNMQSIPGTEEFKKTHSFGILSGLALNYSISKNLYLSAQSSVYYSWGSLGLDYQFTSPRNRTGTWEYGINYNNLFIDTQLGLNLKIQ